MKYLMALFIFITTVSDPWIDMFRSGELGESTEVHHIMDSSGDHSTPEIAASHDHDNMPCSEDDCADCHTCHFGHCGLLIPMSLMAARYESIFLSTFYIEQVSSVSLDGLYRPPKFLA